MPAFLGSHGTLFEFPELPHSGMPVTITQAAGTIDVPTTDLMQFAQELCRLHDQPPLEPDAKVQDFLNMAIEAAVAADRERRISEVLKDHAEEMSRRLMRKIEWDIYRKTSS